MGIPARLQEERNRLGMSQTAFADAIGSTKRSVINWEGGDASPSATVMAAIAAAGADVLYILTGQRSQPVAAQALLPRADRELLADFHAAPADVRAAVKTTLGVFGAAGPALGRKGGKRAA